MKYLSVAIILLLITIGACKKKEVKPFDDSQPVLATDYFPLKAGNYWIYEEFESDTNGNVTSLNIFDSVYVQKDTIVDGINCWKVIDHNDPFQLPYRLFEAQGDLLKEHNGSPIFSANNFSTPLNFYAARTISHTDTAYTVTLQMIDKGTPVKVKGGTFTSITARTTLKPFPKNDCDLVRLFPIRNTIFSYKVGIIYIDMPGWCQYNKITHRELVRYKIN